MNAMHCQVLPNRRRLASPSSMFTVTPLMDIMEGDDGLSIYCNLPGARREEINLVLDKGVLSLHAEALLTPLSGKVHALEFSDVVYEARLRVPAMVDAGNIEATFIDGSLTVSLPYPTQSSPVSIPVNLG